LDGVEKLNRKNWIAKLAARAYLRGIDTNAEGETHVA